jgi:hypothetical protein
MYFKKLINHNVDNLSHRKVELLTLLQLQKQKNKKFKEKENKIIKEFKCMS